MMDIKYSDWKPESDLAGNVESIKPLERSSISETGYENPDEFKARIDQSLEKKTYQHWESQEQKDTNRRLIDNYEEKKIAVDKAALQTQKTILEQYRDYFDGDNIRRMSREFGSNKVEIYNEPYFVAEKLKSKDGDAKYRVAAFREFPDGKICVKDSDNLAQLRHTGSHETMHDLSYQNAVQDVENTRDQGGGIYTSSHSVISSGINQVETYREIFPGGQMTEHSAVRNYYLNEGMTELYTIEAMRERGEEAGLSGYTQEVAWALELRDKVGDDVMAGAYFSGKLEELENKVNGMSDVPEAWGKLTGNIDGYHCSRTDSEKKACMENVRMVLDSMEGSQTRKRTR